MNTSYIINKIKIVENKICCKTRNGRWTNLYEFQGSKDGACAIYSCSMCLKCLNLKETDALFDYFFKNQGMHPNGHDFPNLVKQINRFSENKYKASTFPAIGTEDGEDVFEFTEYIDKNVPIVLGVSWNRTEGHAVLCIGYEVDEKENITKIYCLNPGTPPSKISPWNAYIEIPLLTAGKYPHVFVSDDRSSICRIDDYIILEKS